MPPGRVRVRVWPGAHWPLLSEHLIQQMPEPYSRLLQALGDDEHVRVEVLGVHLHGLLVPRRERHMAGRIVALRPDAHAVPDADPARDLVRLVRPRGERPTTPSRSLGVGDLLDERQGDLSGVRAEPLLDDAGVPHRVQVEQARPDLPDLAATPVVGERDMQR